MTPEARARLIAYSEEWQALASALGWELYGFDQGFYATFIDSHGRSVSLTGTQRDDILRAISAAREEEGL